VPQFQHDNTITATNHYRLVVIAGVLLIAIGCIVGIAVPAGLGWDFANFYDAGRVVAAGDFDSLLKSSKGTIAGAPPQGVPDFWGTPLSAWLYFPLSGFPPETALVLFKIQNVLAYAAALLVLFYHLRGLLEPDALVRWRFAALFTGMALLYQPFWTVFRVGGQTTATVLLLLCVALLMHSRLRYCWSALLFVLAIMIKPALVTALLFLMLVSAGRFALFTLLHLALMGVLSIVVMGWDIQMEFIAKMLHGSGVISRWTYNSSLYALAGELQGRLMQTGDAVYQQTPLVLSIKLAVIASFAWFVITTRNRFASRMAREYCYFMLAILFFLLISQTVWEHYLSFLFLPLALLLAFHDRFGPGLRWMPVVLVASLPLQNLIVIRLLQDMPAFDTLTVLLPVLVLKTAPLWLGWILLLGYRKQLVDICQAIAPGRQ
jgi:hypothetical protein